jgi:hypothetical protein
VIVTGIVCPSIGAAWLGNEAIRLHDPVPVMRIEKPSPLVQVIVATPVSSLV